MKDKDSSPNHRTYSPRRSYLAWRAGTAVFIGLSLAASAKIAADNFPDINGDPAPVLREGQPNTETITVQPGDKVVVPVTESQIPEATTTTQT